MSTPEYPGGLPPQPGNPYPPHADAPRNHGRSANQQQGYAAPAPSTRPVRKRRHPARIALLVILLLVLAGAGGLFVYAQSVRGAITAAAQSFCTDLKTQNYSGAYALLSSSYQSKVTQTQFLQAGQLHDAIDGKVQNCSATDTGSGLNALLQLGSTSITFPARITRNKPFIGNMTLVQQGGAWKVDAIDSSLQGTALGPVIVANDYCTALAAGNVQQAYSDLSPDYQTRIGSEQQYAQSLQNVLTQGVTLTGCTPDLTTYSVTGATAKLNGALAVQENGIAVSIPIALTFTEGNTGLWKIASVTVLPQA